MDDRSDTTATLPAPGSTSLESAPDGRWTLILRRHLPHSPDQVWEALTDPEQVHAWAPYEPERDLGTTGSATLRMIDEPGIEGEPVTADVVIARRPSLLEHLWGEDVLRWELSPSGTGTDLALHHTTAERPQVSSFAAGWHICLDSAALLLDGTPRPPAVGEAAMAHGWAELEAGYRAEFDG